MARLLNSRTGARLIIAGDDHCPPHVHARHTADGWVVRLWFSFASRSVGVIDIAPAQADVRQRQLNIMMDEMVASLDLCRRIWWEGKQTTCLENRWAMIGSPDELILLDRWAVGAKQIRLAIYDVAAKRTSVIFSDGSEYGISAGAAE